MGGSSGCLPPGRLDARGIIKVTEHHRTVQDVNYTIRCEVWIELLRAAARGRLRLAQGCWWRLLFQTSQRVLLYDQCA